MFLPSPAPSATFDCGIEAAGAGMVQRVSTVAFEGIEARAVDVQVQVAQPDAQGQKLLRDAAETPSARGYHRVLRVARTLADLDGAEKSAGCIWPKPCPIARSPRRSGTQPDLLGFQLTVNQPVTSFLYALPTISPLSTGLVFE
jgi:hypothetical protein